MSGKEKYKVVKNKKKQAFVKNGLYYFVQDNIEHLFSKEEYEYKQQSERMFFHIISETTLQPLQEFFQFNDSLFIDMHISFDLIFAQKNTKFHKKNVLTPIHYTLEFSLNNDNDKTVKARSYYDINGKFVTLEATSYLKGKDVGPYLLENLEQKITHFFDSIHYKLMDIIHLHTEAYFEKDITFKACEKINEAEFNSETQLENIKNQLICYQARQRYAAYQNTDSNIDAVEKLLNDRIDDLTKALKKAEEITLPTVVPAITSSKTSPPQAHAKAKPTHGIDKKYQTKFLALIERLKNNPIEKDIFDLHDEIIFDFNQEKKTALKKIFPALNSQMLLFESYFKISLFFSQSIDPINLQKTIDDLKKIETQIFEFQFINSHFSGFKKLLQNHLHPRKNTFITNLFKFFEDAVLSGNENTTKILYAYFSAKKDLKPIFQGLLIKIRDLLIHKTESTLNLISKLITIADFFHEHSEAYRASFINICLLDLPAPPPEPNPSLSIKHTIHFMEGILIKACYNENLPVFEMFLRHGLPLESVQLSCTDRSSLEIEQHSFLDFITTHSSQAAIAKGPAAYLNTLLPFIDVAFQHGARMEAEHIIILESASTQFQFIKQQSPLNNILTRTEYVSSFIPTLVTLLNKYIEYVQPTDIKTLTLLLACLLAIPDFFNSKVTPAKEKINILAFNTKTPHSNLTSDLSIGYWFILNSTPTSPLIDTIKQECLTITQKLLVQIKKSYKQPNINASKIIQELAIDAKENLTTRTLFNRTLGLAAELSILLAPMDTRENAELLLELFTLRFDDILDNKSVQTMLDLFNIYVKSRPLAPKSLNLEENNQSQKTETSVTRQARFMLLAPPNDAKIEEAPVAANETAAKIAAECDASSPSLG